MTQTAAIYGFEFSYKFKAAGLTFIPNESNYLSAKKLARDLSSHNFTGTVYGDVIDSQTIHDLEGVLSFIEHLDVIVLGSVETAYEHNLFASKITAHKRNSGGGAVIRSETLDSCVSSRQQFIELSLIHLRDEEFCNRTRFRSLLFKCVETFRQRQPFLEVSYFLLISGLESFCRASQGDYTSKNAAIPIAKQLRTYGFNVFQDKPSELSRSISTYLHIRNTLFHQGDFTAVVKINDTTLELNCSEYLFSLSMLCSLTVMKAIGFDDGHTNWDCWIDHQLLK